MRLRIAAVVVYLGASGLLYAAQAPTQNPPPPIYNHDTPGLSHPRLIREVKPTYTEAAMRARLQGVVALEAVVAPNGTVTDVRVSRSLDAQYGLDEQAVQAAQRWLFKPAYLNGTAVHTRVTLMLEFRLRGGLPDVTTTTPGQAPPTPPDATFLKGVSVAGDPGVIAPRLQNERHPDYTADAMRQKIQGQVEVQAVVMPDGTVARARVTKSLDRTYGLDDEALKAVHQFTFAPNSGTLNGRPVPVAVQLTLTFKLHE
jgi:TonB family protein